MQPAAPAMRTLWVTAAGTLIALVAFTVPLAAISSTATGLGADTSGRAWILSSTSVGLGAALLSAGTLADDHGRRRTFVTGAAVLAVASVAAAVAPSTLPFVIARSVQGVGGAEVFAEFGEGVGVGDLHGAECVGRVFDESCVPLPTPPSPAVNAARTSWTGMHPAGPTARTGHCHHW